MFSMVSLGSRGCATPCRPRPVVSSARLLSGIFFSSASRRAFGRGPCLRRNADAELAHSQNLRDSTRQQARRAASLKLRSGKAVVQR